MKLPWSFTFSRGYSDAGDGVTACAHARLSITPDYHDRALSRGRRHRRECPDRQ
jgi:hypothetical protein